MREDHALASKTFSSCASKQLRLGFRMVHGLANSAAAAIVAARADQPFTSVDDLWPRVDVPVAALVQIAEADAFRPSLQLARRDALWAIKALKISARSSPSLAS